MKNKITLIAGLPCSGKTTLLNTMKGFNIDDIKSLYQLPKSIENGLNIASPDFIFQDVRRAAILDLKNRYGKDVFIDIIFFENNIKKCLYNLNKRGDQDKKPVKLFIKNLARYYHIPDGVEVVKIVNA